ncbi:P-loop NTPase fold protein [Nitrosomonas marina]|uniref:KAP family P-loop domain-containing protein n=1 Tax=Nitrosomonas marina TaxID=917 RepID=A0A1H8EYT6_9PROT|nr:P-loop NTPase fold protein [Nitrosomonas marina]SEN24653.1 KAP family P-loop domain-containing protein [Nitrosomonas marina]
MQAGVAREALRGLTADLGWWRRWWLALRFSWQEKPLYLIITLVLVMTLIAAPWAVNWSDVIAFRESWAEGNLDETLLPAGISFAVVYFAGKYFLSFHKLFESPLINEWKRYLSLPDYDACLGTIPVMKRQVDALCRLRLGTGKSRAEQKRLLFVVDDLDRCSHTGVVKTLEAVRLILGIPHVTVIIAIDQRIALASLALHYKELAPHHSLRDPANIARDYLGKVIQLPVQLPVADRETVVSFVDQVLFNEDEQSSQALKPGDVDAESLQSGNGGKETVSEDTQKETAERNEQITQNTAARESSQSPADKPQVIETVEYQFSPSEKEVFKRRIREFGFHNPRQLKRLYNSFNLLRHLKGSDQAGDHMLVLFWLEYLNNLPIDQRKAARKGEVWELVQNHFHQDETRYAAIEREVLPFVLPSLDQAVQQQNESNASVM